MFYPLCLPHFGWFPYSGATLSYPSIRFPLSGKPVKYDLDLQKFEYPYLCRQNRGAFPNYSVHGYHTRLGKMEARLPEDKVERIRSALSTFQSQRSTTLQELQSLIGTLNFACKVIPPGRPFLQRIIHHTRKVKKPHHHIKLTTGFCKDIEMWTILFSSMGNLWHPLLVYRCLRLSGLWGNFPKKVVSGKVAAMSTTRPARHQHSFARTICN